MLQPDKAAKFKAILDVLKEDTVSSAQLTPLLAAVIKVVQQAVTDTKAVAQGSKDVAAEAQKTFQDGLSDLKALLAASNATLTTKAQSVLDKAQAALDEVQAIEVKDGEDGDDGAPGAPGKDGSPDTAEEIADKINSLPTDDPDCQIDASHIKNLPHAVDQRIIHGGFRNTTVYSGSTVIAKAMPFLKFSGAGVSATLTKDGIVIVTVPGGSGTAADELAADSGDHTTFTISHTPLASTLLLINENTGQAVPASAYTNTNSSVIFNSNQAVDDGTGTLVTPTFRARYFY